MSDYLAKGKPVRKIADTLGLPLPKPETLNRAQTPWSDQPLAGLQYVSNTTAELINVLTKAGAVPVADGKVNLLLFEANNITKAEQIDDAYRFFNQNLKQLARNGRVLLLVQQSEGDAEAKATQRAYDAFMRSIAKEIGRKGATANLVYWKGDNMAAMTERLAWPVLFFLSAHSAYVNAQPIVVDQIVPFPKDVTWSGSLRGKTAVVTGGARGIGASIARRLAEEGARIIIVDHPSQEANAQAVVQRTNAELILQDISAADAPEKLKDWLQGHTEGVDILVHNAGITRDKTLAKMDEQYWQQVLQVNYRSILAINKVVVPTVLKDGGRIIGMSSISGLSGNFGQTNYAATKAALIGYAAALAPELAGRGITVNAIAPGFIETDMVKTMPFFTKEGGRRLNNLSQAGYPRDIAEATVFLTAPAAAGVTGQVLRVCGGSMIGA